MSDDNLIQNAKKCLAYHGQDGFCEDYDCRSVLEAYELGVASANHRLHAQLAECERERDAARAERERLRLALAGVMKFARPSRGVFCSTECLGQCSECKAMQAADAALAPQPAEKRDPAPCAHSNARWREDIYALDCRDCGCFRYPNGEWTPHYAKSATPPAPQPAPGGAE